MTKGVTKFGDLAGEVVEVRIVVGDQGVAVEFLVETIEAFGGMEFGCIHGEFLS
jgi:hypothetical protein